MKCKYCNIEVEDGTKFCHNCGTPVGEANDTQVQHNDVKQTIENSLEQETAKNKTLTNEDATISVEAKKKANRIGKIAMWSTIAAIIMSFVITGFGFSFWWYLFIIFMVFLVLMLSITVGGSIKSMNDGDVFLAKAVSVACFVCIALLWKCGPLNSDYANEREDVNVSVNTNDYTPSWIEGKWITSTPYGNMTVEIHGKYIREFDGDEYREGTYSISGNNIVTDYDIGGLHIFYIMDFDKKRIYTQSGYYYTKIN